MTSRKKQYEREREREREQTIKERKNEQKEKKNQKERYLLERYNLGAKKVNRMIVAKLTEFLSKSGESSWA